MARPQTVVVMGVSGCGKSAVSEALAHHLGGVVVDGDDLHSPEAVAKMRAGTPLTDEDRWPWLDRVGNALRHRETAAVVACSALKRSYRDRLRTACPGVRFIFLDGDAAVIEPRMRARAGHYMPASLLQSQLQTLELPGEDEVDVCRIDIDQPLAGVLEVAIGKMGALATHAGRSVQVHESIAVDTDQGIDKSTIAIDDEPSRRGRR